MYRVSYSSKQGSFYIETTEGSDDFGTSLYDTEEEAYADLWRMVKEGLITQADVKGF